MGQEAATVQQCDMLLRLQILKMLDWGRPENCWNQSVRGILQFQSQTSGFLLLWWPLSARVVRRSHSLAVVRMPLILNLVSLEDSQVLRPVFQRAQKLIQKAA